MPYFSNPLLLRMGAALAALGGVISLFSSLVAGADFLTIVLRVMITIAFMAALTLGLFFVIQFFAPEILNAIQQNDTNTPSPQEQPDETQEPVDLETKDSSQEFHENPPNLSSPFMDSQPLTTQTRSELNRMKQNIKAGEGEIVVEGVRLPDDPGLMAEAIKDTLDRDTDE